MPENTHDAPALEYWRERDARRHETACRFLVVWNVVLVVAAALGALASLIVSFCFLPDSLWFLFGILFFGIYIALHELATRKATANAPSSCRSAAEASVLFLLLGDLPSMILSLRAGSYSEIPPSHAGGGQGKPGHVSSEEAQGSGQDIDSLYEGAIIYGEIDDEEDLREIEKAVETMRSLHGYKDADSHRKRYEEMVRDYLARKKSL